MEEVGSHPVHDPLPCLKIKEVDNLPYQDVASKPMRDFIVPLGRANEQGFQLEGTGFLIGSSGLIMTAAHVAEALFRGGKPFALFVDGGQWQAVDLVDFEKHSTEDVAVLQLSGTSWHSIHKISRSEEHASQQVMLWGYPERVAHEIRRESTDPFMQEFGVVPEMIYMQGYIRRRLSKNLPTGNLIGSAFFEISECAGSCYSGAPVCPRQPGRSTHVIGIYVGEETAGRSGVGFVVRCSAIADWAPKLSGRPVADEIASMV